jgi:hypothetical protein
MSESIRPELPKSDIITALEGSLFATEITPEVIALHEELWRHNRTARTASLGSANTGSRKREGRRWRLDFDSVARVYARGSVLPSAGG